MVVASVVSQLCCLLSCSDYDSELLQRPDAELEPGMQSEADAISESNELDAGATQDPDPVPVAAPLACEDGACCDTDADCAALDAPVATCGEPERCQGTRSRFVCVERRCEHIEVDDDSACDLAVAPLACEPYLPVRCNGEVEQEPPQCETRCDSDDDCTQSAHCEAGACTPDLPDGGSCSGDSQCESDHCRAGLCCKSGDCCEKPSDCPDGYASGTSCEDPQRCQGSRRVAICSDDFVCGSQQVDDDSACTRSTRASACDAFGDVYCSGGSSQAAPMCKTSCRTEADCDSDAHCSAGVCQRDRADGTSCESSVECESQYCNGGYCCSGGECCGSDEDCDSTSTCVDPGTCQGAVQERSCSAEGQCVNGARRADARACAGQVARGCGAYRDVRCPATAVAVSGSCATSCSASWECNPGYTCSDGSCVID